MKKNLIRLLPLVLLAAGCTREIVDPLAENRGLTVDFLFSTHYTQGSLLTKAPDDLFDSPVTKTVFSGKDENGQDVTSSSQKERIDWKVGDKVDLMILKAGAPKDRRVYEIKAFTTEGNLKSKSVSVSSDNPFTFKGSGDYYIFATYPSHSIGKAFKTGNGYDYGLWNPSSTTGGFGLYMPENIACSIVDKGDSYVVMDDMDYAVMTAGKSVNLSSPQAIELDFKPFFNAYQLLLTNTETTRNYKLETLTITCTSGFLRTKADVSNRLPSLISADGTMSWNNYTPGTDRCIGSFTYNFKQLSGYSEGIPFNKPLDITLLALPIAQSGISITFTFSGGITRTLTLDPSVTLDSSHKLRIYNIGEGAEWIYVIDPIDNIYFPGKAAGTQNFSINSYRYRKVDPSVKEFVPWEIVGFAEDSTAAFANRGGSNGFSIATLERVTSSGIGFVNSASVTEQTQKVVSHAESDIVTLQSRRLEYNGVFGTEAQPRDLAMYDIFGNKRAAGKPVTANSYVVDRGGWYMFPVVYGNAIDYTVVENKLTGNVRAYAPTMPSEINAGDHNGQEYKNYLTPFLNAAGNGISGPYILSDMGLSEGAVSVDIVWQDLSQQKLTVSDVQLVPGTGISATGTDSGLNCAYIKFRVGKDNLYQCNAVLALKNGSGEIVWSWHIWVTGDKMTVSEIPLTTDPAFVGGTPYKSSDRFLDLNLGWCDAGSATVTDYPSRMLYAKVRQTDPASSAYRIFKIAQSGESEWIDSQYGDSPQYQYGRKDPLLPSSGVKSGEIVNKEHYPSVQRTYGSNPERYINTLLPGFSGSVNTLNNQKKIVKELINNPHKMLVSSNSDTYSINRWETYYPYNTWSGLMRLDKVSVDFPVVKTIYDPCPPGFCVPHQYSFTGFYGRDLDEMRIRRSSGRIGMGDVRGALNQTANAGHYLRYGSAYYLNMDLNARSIQTLHNYNTPGQTFVIKGDQQSPISYAYSIRPVMEDIIYVDNTVDGQRIVIGDGGNWEN